jgi:hypothetical protein
MFEITIFPTKEGDRFRNTIQQQTEHLHHGLFYYELVYRCMVLKGHCFAKTYSVVASSLSEFVEEAILKTWNP